MPYSVTIGGVVYSNLPLTNEGPPTVPWGSTVDSVIAALAAQTGNTTPFMLQTQVSTTPVTIASGNAYLVQSNIQAITLNLPQPAVNSWILITDIGNNASVNNITVRRFSSEKIDGVSANKKMTYNGASVILISDGTNWYSMAGQHHHVSHELYGEDQIVNGMCFSSLAITSNTGISNTHLITESIQLSIALKTSNYTLNAISDSIIFGNAASGPVYLTLPNPLNIGGQVFHVKKVDATSNGVAVVPASGSVDGGTMSLITAQYTAHTYASDNGTNWYTL